MNERFAAEPVTCDSAFQLKHLLEKFGPVTGRYLAKYPSVGWIDLLRKHIASWDDVERKMALDLLEIAQRSGALVPSNTVAYDEQGNWLQNVVRTQASASRFDGVVVSRASAGAFPSVEQLELPPTAEERVAAKSAEYVRVSRTLLETSSEVHFIDPYLNPCDRDRQGALRDMLRVASAGICEAAYVWASDDERKHSTAEKVAALRRIAIDAGFVGKRRLELCAFTDAGGDTKVHDRYLLSLKGAIRFEHGFQELTGKRSAKVSPEGPASHLLLLKTFHEGRNDLRVESFLIDI